MTAHKFHVVLSCPENMKQLARIVSEYWPGQYLDGWTNGWQR